MNEENKFGPKKRWTRIFRKKWFFPSLYLMLAALLISAVVWYQNNGEEQVVDESQEQTDYNPIPSEEDAQAVMADQEVIKFPVANADEAEVVTKFFDYNADESEKVNALIHYNNRYYQSTGIDIAAADGESFEVIASLSGTVSEVKEDPLLGNVVVIDHENDVKTYYASLGEVTVVADDKVEQGDVLGTAGKNNFGKDNGNHVHFEIRKGETALNPEAMFNQPLASLDAVNEEVTEEEAEQAEPTETTDGAVEESEPTDATDEDAEPTEEDTELSEDTDADEDAVTEEDESEADAEESEVE